jgi:hypothetical protein
MRWTLVLVLGGCTGALLDVDPPSAEQEDPGPECPPPGAETRIRRLNRFEYDATVRDLLGDHTRPAQAFPPEEEANGFDNDAALLTVSDLGAEKYLLAAETLASAAVADLPSLLPCDPAPDEAACARAFIERFGRRAYRRPLDGEEIAILEDVYAQARAEWDFAAGIKLVIETMLQSPQFLYRVEIGEPRAPGEIWQRLTPWETASRLSYLLWGSMPDDGLFRAAEDGKLATRAEVETQARRLLADPRALEQIAHFHERWLGLYLLGDLDKDPATFPEYSPGLRPSMLEEMRRFVAAVFTEGGGTLTTLFTGSFTFVDAALAAYYGVPAPAGDDFARVELPAAHAAGILTLGGLMAMNAGPNQTSPVLRGKFVQEQLLCNPLPPPPDDIDIKPPELDATLTTRERFAQHRADPTCSGCHDFMDPIGFAFEHFDGAGRWRDLENGLVIDDSGELVGSDNDAAFTGPVELGALLAGSAQVRGCLTRQWFRYAYGRVAGEGDACTLASLETRLADADGDLRELVIGLSSTDVFRYRQGGAP